MVSSRLRLLIADPTYRFGQPLFATLSVQAEAGTDPRGTWSRRAIEQLGDLDGTNPSGRLWRRRDGRLVRATERRSQSLIVRPFG